MNIRNVEFQSLAINGGSPVRSSPLPYGHQSIDQNDVDAVIEVLKSDWLTTGPKVAEFEQAIAERVGSKYAVTFSSGTAALHGAAYAAGLTYGNEAITSPLTFCATANCVLYTGATPVFADITYDTLNIDPQDIENHITDRTKAILPVDYAGHPVDLDKIMALAEKYNLIIIEDAAHALGAEFKNRKVGSISHLTTFSFHPVKHIATGEGGMVTTDDSDLATKLKTFRNHGITTEARQRQELSSGAWFYEMEDLGFNYRLSDISCALGISQLAKFDENVRRRREIAQRYSAEWSDNSCIIIPVEKTNVVCVWHIYPIRLRLDNLKVGREQIFDALRAENIQVNVHYIPVHLHPYYRDRFGFRMGDYPVAELAYEQLITLPIFPGMSDGDVGDVIDSLNKVVNYYRSN